MIKENVSKIRERILSACSRAKRKPESITLVAVSKERGVGQIRGAIEAGITDIGENKVQEALIKYNEIGAANGERRLKWHLVGHLQTNKVKEAIKVFDLIHSIDSLHLAAEIDKQASRMGKIQDILIQVNTSGEASKFGLRPEEAVEAIKEMTEFKDINIKGLMTIAPMADSPEKARPYFRMLRELKEKINESRITRYELGILSMGMTDDFEVAIEEGADMIRLGRAIFEG